MSYQTERSLQNTYLVSSALRTGLCAFCHHRPYQRSQVRLAALR
jgi:hypothetical protein